MLESLTHFRVGPVSEVGQVVHWPIQLTSEAPMPTKAFLDYRWRRVFSAPATDHQNCCFPSCHQPTNVPIADEGKMEAATPIDQQSFPSCCRQFSEDGDGKHLHALQGEGLMPEAPQIPGTAAAEVVCLMPAPTYPGVCQPHLPPLHHSINLCSLFYFAPITFFWTREPKRSRGGKFMDMDMQKIIVELLKSSVTE